MTDGSFPAHPLEGSSPRGAILQNVSKTFAGQVVLRDVSLEFRPGEVHCLLGQNGSGKSTLIKILSGFHLPDRGSSVVVGTQPLEFGNPDSTRRLGMRFVHQQLGIISQLSAVENTSLGFGLATSKWGFHRWAAQEARARSLLERIGVTDLDVRMPLKDARAVDRTAVAIARAVDPAAGDISFLFLDEPTAALPPAEVDRLFELLKEIKTRGTGIIYVSHRLDEVFRIGDRVSVLRDGRHVGTHRVDDLDKRRLIEVIVGEEGRPAVAAEARHVPEARAVRGTRGTEDAQETLPAARLAVEDLRADGLGPVSLELGPGEILGVAGLAGSGREQLLYAIVGASPSKAKSITMAGTYLGTRLTPRTSKLVGIVLAPGNRMSGSAVARFTLRENITLPVVSRYRHRLSRWVRHTEERATARRWLTDLQVGGAWTAKGVDMGLPELSGGNQQKVILAKAFNVDPQIVLLDEPTSGVDVGARESIYALIRQYARDGVSFVIASSDIDDLLAVCDRVVVLAGGKIADELSGEEVNEPALLAAIAGREGNGGTHQPMINKEPSQA